MSVLRRALIEKKLEVVYINYIPVLGFVKGFKYILTIELKFKHNGSRLM